MAAERLQTISSKDRLITVSKKTLRAASTAAILTAGTLLPNTQNATSEVQNFTSGPIQQISQSMGKNEQVSDMLENWEVRSVIMAGLALSLAGVARAYFWAQDYDDGKVNKTRRVLVPSLATAAMCSFLADSYTDVPSEIPAGIILGASLLAAAQVIIDAHEHRKSVRHRSAAWTTAGALIALGTTFFIAASDKI